MRKSIDIAEAMELRAAAPALEADARLAALDTALIELLAKRLARALRIEAQPDGRETP